MNTEFEDMLPEWAIGKAEGKLVIGAQLPTRDGRRMGNAHIVGTRQATWDAGVTLYEILTDAGNRFWFTAGEVAECFYPPVWVSDIEEVVYKFSARPQPDAKTLCCKSARASRGWHHEESCPNWVLTY